MHGIADLRVDGYASQRRIRRVVCVEHGNLWLKSSCIRLDDQLGSRGRQTAEQDGLGVQIGLPGAVIVQVLVGHVGDYGHVEVTRGHAALMQGHAT